MKRDLLLFLLLFGFLGLYSQNWAPINTTEKFCYSSDDTLDIINNVLWVDSVKIFGNQEVYYLNKIIDLFNEEDNKYMYDEPQFLLDSIILSEDGGWYFVDDFPIPDNDNFYLFPNANLGYEWDFSSGITAQISAVDTSVIFGIQDSIKQIDLSNGQRIVISKEHGIVNWKDEYSLVGIEGRDLGSTVFKFEDMFEKISVGNILCRKSYEWIADETVTGFLSQERQKILEIERFADSIVIQIEFHKNTRYEWGSTITYSNSYGIRDMKYYRNDSTDIYPNMGIYNGNYDEGNVITSIAPHKWSGPKKTQKTYEGVWGPASVFYECEDLYPKILCPHNYNLVLVEYSRDYGFLESEFSGFEYGTGEVLEGIIDNGDTLGVIYPLEMFVGNDEPMSNLEWHIYPNPTQNILKISSSKMGGIEYQIFHVSGQLIQQKKIRKAANNQKIDISHLANGAYILKILMDGEVFQQKFIKQY